LPTPEDRRGDEALVEEWARGLEWVRWLLSSVRARTDTLLIEDGDWEAFADGAFRQTIGPSLQAAWSAAHVGDLADLIAADHALTQKLDHSATTRSTRAGAILLKTTRHARYQGILGHFRDAIESGRSPGHLTSIWAAVGHLFQLSLANVTAEYLRLEWDIGTRANLKRQIPSNRLGFTQLTSELLSRHSAEPRPL
jgi:urease accessory protein UreF